MKKLFCLVMTGLLAGSLAGCMFYDDCDSSCEYKGQSRWSSSDGHYSWATDYGPGYGEYTALSQENEACIWDVDCVSGLICQSRICVVPDVARPVEDKEIECRSNADCQGDDICTDGRCIPCQTDQCDTSREVECVFSTQCESGLCVDGVCLAAGKCAIDANCSDGQICRDGECIVRPECLSDAECGEGRVCNPSGNCEDDVECRKDDDCGEGKFCVANMCAECRLNCECPNEGDICMNGVCVAK